MSLNIKILVTDLLMSFKIGYPKNQYFVSSNNKNHKLIRLININTITFIMKQLNK
jgi:hypothetical protein